MSVVPNHYNADDYAGWERYAAALQMWIAQRGPHPGNPPPGYRKVFKLRQRYAPCPEDFPVPQLGIEQAAPAPPVPGNIPGVTMTEGAFSTLLTYNAALQSQLGAISAAQANTFHYFGQGGSCRQPGSYAHGTRGGWRGSDQGGRSRQPGRGAHGAHGGRGGWRGSGRGGCHGGRLLPLVDRVGGRNSSFAGHGNKKPHKRGKRGGRGRRSGQEFAPQPEGHSEQPVGEQDKLTCYEDFINALITALTSIESDQHYAADDQYEPEPDVGAEGSDYNIRNYEDEPAVLFGDAEDFPQQEWI
ncbi:hypothetical protein C8Q74DRAFT_1366903 [Fomes fomentarius]|nr:hypothetical protein C8Q74DRAFT_1366903 [Fomes fomentarius]